MKRFNINIKMRRKTRGLQLFLRIHFNNNNKLIVCLQECFHNVQNVSRFSTWAHPILLQHLQPLCDLPQSVCKHDICYHGKYLGNSGLQFLQVRNWGSKNLGLGKTQRKKSNWVMSGERGVRGPSLPIHLFGKALLGSGRDRYHSFLKCD